MDLHFNRGLGIGQMAIVTGTNMRLVRDSFVAHDLRWRSRSEAMRGLTRSAETRAKVAEARRGTRDVPEVAARKCAHLLKVNGWSKGLTVATDARVARQAEAATRVMQSPEWRARMSALRARQIATGTFYERGYHVSPKAGKIYFMSSWEEDRWHELDQDNTVATYRRPGVWLPYMWEGHVKHYVPDVLITYTDGRVVLEEIRPRRIAEQDEKTKAKLVAGAEYAAKQGWEFRAFLRDK